MINGILFFENGEVQVIGEIKGGRQLIAAMYQIIPQLLEQEKKAVLDSISTEELEAALNNKRKGV